MPMSTAEAHALSLQANGLLAELTRWQREHPTDADCRLTDAIDGMTDVANALGHLALGTEYPESAAAREAAMRRTADPSGALMGDEPVPLVTAD